MIPLCFGEIKIVVGTLPLFITFAHPSGVMEVMAPKRLMFVHCAPKSTPPHFVANVMKIIVMCVLTYALRKWKL